MELKLGIYKHTKSGNLYQVIGVGKQEETLEDMVFYEALYDNPVSKFWVRPLSVFTESIHTPDGYRPRFCYVD